MSQQLARWPSSTGRRSRPNNDHYIPLMIPSPDSSSTNRCTRLPGSDTRVVACLLVGLTVTNCNTLLETTVDASAPTSQRITQLLSNKEGARMRMVEQQLLARDITDPRVISAMRRIPRDSFVPPDLRQRAYEDRPLPIGYRQTISQPYIVAYMTQALRLGPNAKVLEIGTGSGYQAAVLSELAGSVYSIEIVAQLAKRARDTLKKLGYDNVQVKQGDGYAGWPDQAPFDAIMVTAAPDHVPQPLVNQLALGGRLVLPVGETQQTLMVLIRTEDGVEQEATLPVLFVPMTGEAERR